MVTAIDTHAHLCDPAFDDDLEAVLDRARSSGVTGVVAVGETVADARRNLELASNYPDLIHAAAGLFPTILDPSEAEDLIALIRRFADRWVAIGEVGLDYWKVQDEDGRSLQREIFTAFVDLASELDLPLNVHSRSAGAKAIELLLEQGASRVQMHAFDGRAASALPAVEAGFFFSVPPSVVRSAQKQKLVRRVPLDNLLAETDSPVLGSDPEVRNEPAAVMESLRAISLIKDVGLEEVAERMRANSNRLYGSVLSR
jgi:TatD DNase family protein